MEGPGFRPPKVKVGRSWSGAAPIPSGGAGAWEAVQGLIELRDRTTDPFQREQIKNLIVHFTENPARTIWLRP